MYYYEKIKLQFEKDHNDITIVVLEKLMTRCLKVYEMIDNFMKIFKLINDKVKLDAKIDGD
jgi:hypothetical protein